MAAVTGRPAACRAFRRRCPASINTGALIKTFRRAESTPQREKAALRIAQR